MDKDKERQEISIIGRLFCIEALLLLMGVVSLVSWFFTHEPTQLFWGVMIIGGSVVLYFVRKKDWKKHWEDQERLRELYEAKERERKEKDAAGRK